MEFSLDEVRHVAELARLELTEEEVRAFVKDLSDILRYVDKLQQLDTSDVEPTLHVVPLQNVMREDRVLPSLSVDEVMSNAPDRSGDFFRVPRILETDQ